MLPDHSHTAPPIGDYDPHARRSAVLTCQKWALVLHHAPKALLDALGEDDVAHLRAAAGEGEPGYTPPTP